MKTNRIHRSILIAAIVALVGFSGIALADAYGPGSGHGKRGAGTYGDCPRYHDGYHDGRGRWEAANLTDEQIAQLDKLRTDFHDATADLRADLRQAAATIETNEIQRGAVLLAERRVASARLRLAAGRADTRDILEAQEDLLQAKNAATRSTVDHHLALLALWRDVEVLRVDESGITLEESLLEPGVVQP